MKKLGKFEIISKVGQGAMGVVYKARDPLIDRIVALKTLTTGVSEDSTLLKRFYSEARSAGSLRHPNIVTIYELGHEGEVPFIAMQFLQGESLDRIIDRTPNLPLSQRVGFIVHICRALDYAHKRNPPVIHRDIKPGNVMIGPDGSVVVVDFGIARLGENTVSQSAGMLIGTLGYMAPQLFRGGTADARSDIWAAGVVFYEVLAYRRPFKGDTAAQLVSNIVLEEPRSIREAAPGTPEEIEQILKRMLAKEAEDRYQTMEEVLADLEPVWKRLLQADVAVLLQNSERYFQEGDLLAAKSEIVQILNWDAANASAKSLADKINGALRRQEVFPQVKAHLENAQKLLAEGHIAEAKSEAEAAVRLDSSCQPARELVRQAQEALERSREIARAIQAGKQRMAEGSLTEAEKQLDKALTLDPENTTAKEHRKQLQDQRARRELRKQRDSFVQRARALWTDLQLDDCINLLVAADKQFPDDAEIVKFLEVARQDQIEQQRQILFTEVRNQLSAQQFEAALQSLDAFLAKSPSDATANRLRSHALQGREQQRREQHLNQGKGELRSLLEGKKYKEAIARGKELERELQPDFELEELIALAGAEQSLIEQRERLEKVTQHIKEVMKSGRFGEAIQAAERALFEFPNNAEFISLIAQIKKEQAEKEKQTLTKQRIREVERMVEHHRLTDAIDLAQQTITTVGPDSRLVDILLKAEKELEFREEKRRRQAETLRMAEALLHNDKAQEAEAILKGAQETGLFEANDLQAKALLEEAEAKKQPPNVAAPELSSPPSLSVPFSSSSATDPAKDYIYTRGESKLEGLAAAAAQGMGGAVPGPATSGGKSLQPPLVPAGESLTARGGPAAPSEIKPDGVAGEDQNRNLRPATIEKHLVPLLGPMARLIVQRAAANAKNQEHLFALVVSALSSERDRQAFLARKEECLSAPAETQSGARSPIGGGSTEAAALAAGSATLNAADIRRASELLARYLGPVSRILAQRAVKRADNVRGLYLILAEHLTDRSERSRFLREAGFPET